MKIVARSERGADWCPLESVGYHVEKELQALLEESPSLIPIDEVRENASPLVAAVREVWLPGVGAIDVLAFSGDGQVTVVECKLAANPDRRQVLAQVVDYASALWDMGYDDLNERIRKKWNSDLALLVKKHVKPGVWNEEAFRQGVASALASGFFNLIIAVDQIDDHLRRMIRYLNIAGRPEFRLAGLEMERFQTEIGEVLVPRIYAPQVQTASSRGSTKWDDVRFYAACHESLSDEVVQVISALHEWGGKHFEYGSGEKYGSLNYYLWLGDKGYPRAFQVTDRGRLYINYGELPDSLGEEAIRRFQERLSEIPSFARLPSDLTRYPSIVIADSLVNVPQDVEQFKAAVEELERELRG